MNLSAALCHSDSDLGKSIVLTRTLYYAREMTMRYSARGGHYRSVGTGHKSERLVELLCGDWGGRKRKGLCNTDTLYPGLLHFWSEIVINIINH